MKSVQNWNADTPPPPLGDFQIRFSPEQKSITVHRAANGNATHMDGYTHEYSTLPKGSEKLR